MEVTADDGSVLVSILAYFSLDPDDVTKDVYVPEDRAVEWHLDWWDQNINDWVSDVVDELIESSDTTIDDMGQAAAKISTGTTAGYRYRAWVKLPYYGATKYYSGELIVVAGVTKRIEFANTLDTQPVAPEQTFEVKATLYDDYSNLVLRQETLAYFYETGLFEIAQPYDPSPDSNGQITVQLRLKEITEDQDAAIFSCEADSFVAATWLDVSPVIAHLFVEVPQGTGVPELDIDVPQTVNLRARFEHASGTKVHGISIEWKTTNGQIVNAQTTLDANGEATAILSAAGGISGPAIISVTQTGGAYGANGEVHLRQANSVELACAFLPLDEAHTCDLLINGPAGGGARITGGGAATLLLYSYSFETREDTLTGAFTPDDTAGWPAHLVGVAPGATDWHQSMPGGGYGLSCANGRCAAIPLHARLAFRTGVVLEAYIIPLDHTASAAIISKSPDFRLFMENSRIKFSIATNFGSFTVQSGLLGSSMDVPPDANGGYAIKAEFHLGLLRLWVNGGDPVVLPPTSGSLMPGNSGPVGLAADLTGDPVSGFTASNLFTGLMDNVRITRILSVRTGSTQLTLDQNGQGSFPLTLDGGPDPDNEGPEINTDVLVVTVLIEITNAGGSVVASRSTDVYLTGRQHGDNIKRSTGDMGTALSLGAAMITHVLKEQVIAPYRSFIYLCGIPFRDETDWKRAGLAFWDVITTVPIPGLQITKIKKVQQILQAGGKVAKVIILVSRIAGRIQRIHDLLGYLDTLHYIITNFENTLDLIKMVIESQADLDVLKLLSDYLEANDRPLLDMVMDAAEVGLNEEAGYPAVGSPAPLMAALAFAAPPPPRPGKPKRRKTAGHHAAKEKDSLDSPTSRNHHKSLHASGKASHHNDHRSIYNSNFRNASRPDLDFPPKCIRKILDAFAKLPIPRESHDYSKKRLAQNNSQVMGNLAEIIRALEMHQNGEFQGLADVNRQTGKTDWDLVGKDGSIHQIKHSNRSKRNDSPPPEWVSHPRPPGLKSIEDWCAKAKKEKGGSYDGVHLHLPIPIGDLPPKLKSYVEKQEGKGLTVHYYQIDARRTCN